MSRVRIRVRDRLGIKGEKHKNNTKQHKTRVRAWVRLGEKRSRTFFHVCAVDKAYVEAHFHKIEMLLWDI